MRLQSAPQEAEVAYYERLVADRDALEVKLLDHDDNAHFRKPVPLERQTLSFQAKKAFGKQILKTYLEDHLYRLKPGQIVPFRKWISRHPEYKARKIDLLGQFAAANFLPPQKTWRDGLAAFVPAFFGKLAPQPVRMG